MTTATTPADTIAATIAEAGQTIATGLGWLAAILLVAWVLATIASTR